MKKVLRFKGTVYFLSREQRNRRPLFHYEMDGEDVPLQSSLMSTFDEFCFSYEEKQMLSLKQRKNLSHYLQLNPFKLNGDALKLIKLINDHTDVKIVIEASDYGAFVCMAAIYSGKIDPSKKIEFHFKHSPVALFPKNLMKSSPKLKFTINYKFHDDSWIDQFETLYDHKIIPIKIKKAA